MIWHVLWWRKMSHEREFTEGKIYSPLLRFMLPLLLANFLQALYSAGDMLIIGLFGTTGDVSAVSTGSGIVDMVRTIIAGLSIGTTVLLGQQLGKEKTEDAGRVVGTSIWSFGILGLLLTILLFIPATCWAQLMQAPEEAFHSTVLYIRICAAGTVFVAWYNVLGAIFRGVGDSKTPLIIVSVSFILNFIADIILVGYFRLGAGGSAITNVFAQALSVGLGARIINRRHLPFPFHRTMIRKEAGHLSNIFKVGLPMALQDLLVSLSFLVIIAIINDLGVTASAGAGVAEKVCAFIMIVPGSFSQALSAYVAQNIGARKPQRAIRGMIYAILTSIAAGFMMFLLAWFRGDLLIDLFVSGKPDVVAAGWDYLRAYAVDCLLTPFVFCLHGFFIGAGHTRFVALEGLFCAFGVRIPVSWLMSRRLPVSMFHVGLGIPCSSIVGITVDLLYLHRCLRHPDSLKPLDD